MSEKTVKITLPDGSIQEHPDGVTPLAIAEGISSGLAKNTIVARVNDKLVDINEKIECDANLQLLTKKDPESLEVLRHSTAHVMAQAVMRVFKNVKLDIGPAVENGFYYDFDLEHRISPEDFEKIESEMQNIMKEKQTFERKVVTKEEAVKIMKEAGQDFKLDRIDDAEGETLTIYQNGEFMDFCRGPHVPDTGQLGAFKLTKVAGSYFRGDVNNKMLQRVYGTTFFDKKELKKYLNFLEEAKKRDHRLIGKQMDLFSFQPEGPGFPFWHPKGMSILNELYTLWRERHRLGGYQEIKTPMILNEELWHRSGHWDNYKENMYFTSIDEKTYAVRPMNCPGGLLVYKSQMRSYRDLPIRMGELGQVHRHELSGVLQGMFRVRTFVVDDAHIFCTPDQLLDEVIGVIKLALGMYETFGLNAKTIEISTRPEKSIGSDEMWELATNVLIKAMEAVGMEYEIREGDGAFYGPKIDFHIEDTLHRTWQCGTIQVDFAMPERFDLEYMGADGERHRPVMVHRAIYGSPERFLAILVENFAGKFPLWLAPTQVRLLPITDKQRDYLQSLEQTFLEANIRFDKDFRSEKIGAKIRQATLDNVPYMIIAGEDEANQGIVSVRHRTKGDQGTMSLEDFINMIKENISSRSLEY